TGPCCPTEPLVLQVPARALLEGDTVTLRCRGRPDKPVTSVRFYKDQKYLWETIHGTLLFLAHLQQRNSDRYWCLGSVSSGVLRSAPVPVTVH
ncbi:FCGR3 protein, partial [Cinclus mexicanus]|nr:FCGR3 protein [Cinclus mexicanus]